MWASVCLFVDGLIGRIVGVSLYWLFGMVFDVWVAVLIAYVVFPAFVFLHLRKTEMPEAECEQVSENFSLFCV